MRDAGIVATMFLAVPNQQLGFRRKHRRTNCTPVLLGPGLKRVNVVCVLFRWFVVVTLLLLVLDVLLPQTAGPTAPASAVGTVVERYTVISASPQWGALPI